MATSTVSLPALGTGRRALRGLLLLLLVLAIGAVAMTGWFWWAAHAALPQVDGRLSLPGLHAPVTVTRDGQGVPHISAASVDDLFFAQGYVTAQDRLWQMDMLRRFAAGEIAEVLGKAYVKHDRQQRTLLIRSAAENAAARLTPEDRANFEAYARGVNAYIAGQSHLPIEFRVLHYYPRAWTVTDSFLVATNMVQMLNLETLGHMFARERISAKLPPELAADLYPNSSWRDHPPVSQDEFVPPDANDKPEAGAEQPEAQQPDPAPRARRHRHAARPQATPDQVRPAHRRRRHLHRAALESPAMPVSAPSRNPATVPTAVPTMFDAAAIVPGSNNWVVSGAHTVSGKPLLANDMHLGHQVPNVWYEAQLTVAAPGASDSPYDVAGVTLPGLPYVIVGHNRRIAWGFTNIGPAVGDVYIENFNSAGEYQTPEGWRQPEHRREVIHVKRGLDETLDVAVTRHGPIISGIELPSRLFGEKTAPVDRSRQLALRWTLYDAATLQVPFFALNTAQNWEEFRRALSRFGSPAQNVVYADVDGHIGYQATGMIPVRAAAPSAPDATATAALNDGSLPVSGADNSHEWTGYIPFDQLPSVLDPPSGVIATANGRIAPDGYSSVISNEWGPPFRTERIYHVLTSGKKFLPADMLALQTDIYSDFDRFCAQRFVYAMDHSTKVTPRGKQAAEIMRAWDGHVTTDSAAAGITAASRQQLVRLLLQPRVGEEWQDYQWFMASVWIENLLLKNPDRWLPPNYTNWDDLLTDAVEAALSQPAAPSKLSDWHPGKERVLDLRHPIFGMVPLLRRFAGTGRYEQSGNGYTVKQVGSHFGPSERLTVDFSDLDASTLNIVNGQSGQIFSKHFNDQWKPWYEGRTFPLPFTATAVEKAKEHQLVLEPGK